MTLPVPNSFSGKAQATTLTASISNTALSFSVASASTWTETAGTHIGSPLGTSGAFVITLDYGLSTEEKVLCSNITGSGPFTVNVYNSGGQTGRGFDGTSAVGHDVTDGGAVIHTYSADVPYQANRAGTAAAAAQTTANTANTNAAAAQTTANAALPKAGGTMTGAIAMGSHKITGLSNGTSTNDAINYGQLSPVSTAAYGVNLTGATPLTGTNPTYPATLINYTFTTVLSLAAGSGIISFPSTLPHSVLGVNISVVASASGTGVTQGATVQVVDGTTQLYSCNIKCLDATGAGITGSVRFMVTVCGY